MIVMINEKGTNWVFDEIAHVKHHDRALKPPVDETDPAVEAEPINDRYHEVHYFGLGTVGTAPYRPAQTDQDGSINVIQVDCKMRDDRNVALVIGAANAFLCNDQGKTIGRLR